MGDNLRLKTAIDGPGHSKKQMKAVAIQETVDNDKGASFSKDLHRSPVHHKYVAILGISREESIALRRRKNVS